MAQRAEAVGQAYRIPGAAQDAWSELADVLHTDGPAPCEGSTPDAWWPTRTDDPDDAALATRCCVDCPARVECLAYALAADERDGIWGGLTPAERMRLAAPVAA